jgi:hypothetical protein
VNTAEVARRFAEKRPGYSIVSFGEVGLPFYRIRLRAQVLERKPVPPMEEIVMAGIESKIDERETLRELLGLDTLLFDGVLAELLRKEHILLSRPGRPDLELTDSGRKVLVEAREIAPADLGLEVHFDYLLRTVVPSAAGLIDARRMDSIGLREVPPARPRPPELPDLDPDAVQRVELRHPGPNGATADLLALKRIDRRTRVFRPAAIMVYLGDQQKEVQVAFVVDGEISVAHESAFAAARLTTKMGVRTATMEHPAQLFQPVFGRELEGTVAGTDEDSAPCSLLPCFELPGLLRESLDQSRRRLLVVSPRLTPEIVDPEFLDSLRRRLAEGTDVYFGIGPERTNTMAVELERSAIRPLDQLYRNYRNFRLKRFSRLGPALLARDDELAVLTRFNWLGYEGDLDRHYVDERGIQLRDPKLVDELFAVQIPRFG